MKILYVDLEFDYGDINRGINQIGQLGFKNSFLKLGFETFTFYYDKYLNSVNEDQLQNDLLKFADQTNPDLIFFCLYTEQFKTETLQKLKNKFKTINWFGDDQWRFESFTQIYAPHFTYCITTDEFSVSKYHKLGIQQVFLSQWAAIDYEYEKPQINDLNYDISFVGGFSPARKWFVDEFKKSGFHVETFGNGWSNGPVSLSEMRSIFASSKINLNLSNSSSYDIRYIFNHPKNFYRAFKGQKNSSQIKARNFEIPYFGGFQLTDYVPNLEKYLEIGNEVACYSNVDEAILLTQYYLSNENKRLKIIEASYKRCHAEHTYFHRLKSAFNFFNINLK